MLRTVSGLHHDRRSHSDPPSGDWRNEPATSRRAGPACSANFRAIARELLPDAASSTMRARSRIRASLSSEPAIASSAAPSVLAIHRSPGNLLSPGALRAAEWLVPMFMRMSMRRAGAERTTELK